MIQIPIIFHVLQQIQLQVFALVFTAPVWLRNLPCNCSYVVSNLFCLSLWTVNWSVRWCCTSWMKDSSCYNTVFLFRIMSKLIDLMLTVKMLQKKVTKSWRQRPSKYEKNKKITAAVQQLIILVTSVVFLWCGSYRSFWRNFCSTEIECKIQIFINLWNIR